jgi:two-component system, chemotaxis family, chemotaxis protein CheY
MAKRLLITDDAEIMREIIKDAAVDAGWEVAGFALDGQEAINKYKELKPDAVTLDLVMPVYDGLHALRGILAYDPDATVLVVSALDQRNVLKEAFKTGATDFLVKPFDKADLISALTTHDSAQRAVNP